MAENNTYSPYTLADIERYLQGKMNAREMHDLEKAALQDPFLSDSIEGFSQAPFAASHTHLSQISAALQGQKEPARIIAMPVKQRGLWKKLAVAASIVAVGIIGWMIINNRENKTVAIQNVPVMPAPKQQADSTLTAKQQVKPLPGSSKIKTEDTYSYSVSANNAPQAPAAVNPGIVKDELKVAQTDTAQLKQLTAANYGQADKFKQDTIKALGEVSIAQNNALANNATNNKPVLQGPAFNQNNFTNNLPATNAAKPVDKDAFAVTKKRGQDDLAKAKVADGPAAKRETFMRIQLNPTPGFDSTVAVTYLNNRSHDKKMVIDSSFIPQGGWESFRDYVSRHIHQEIDSTAEAIAEGDVELEFGVDELTGIARDIKVTRSLNGTSDAEAIDLVKKWPSWISTKKNKKNKVVIQF